MTSKEENTTKKRRRKLFDKGSEEVNRCLKFFTTGGGCVFVKWSYLVWLPHAPLTSHESQVGFLLEIQKADAKAQKKKSRAIKK